MSDIENFVNELGNDQTPKAKKINRMFRRILLGIGIFIVLVLVLSNIYVLGSNEEAVITMFGKHVRTEREAGLKLKIPLVEKKQKVDVQNIRRMEFGYRSIKGDQYEDKIEESQMLTSDENIVVADWTVQYKINDSYNYLFNVDDQQGTLRTITEAAYRRIVASHPLDDILTNKKETIQFEVKDLLQSICNKYRFGITVTTVQLQDALPPEPVKAAFLEVASAKEDKNAKINEAKKYSNENLPIAKGKAEQILNQAEGYKQQRINEATGDVARFSAIEQQYALNQKVTKTRLYLEAIKQVLPTVKEVYIMADNGQVLKFLPMDGTLQPAK